MVNVRKATGREPGRFKPYDINPRIVSRMGIYDFASGSTSATEFNIAGHLSGSTYNDRNILIHWIKAINDGTGVTNLDQTKELHFWSGDTTHYQDILAGNRIFSITVPPSNEDTDGGLDVSIDFPIPLLIEGGGRIAITTTNTQSFSANFQMQVTICYTVLNSRTVGDSSIRYKFLSATTTDTGGNNAVPKVGAASVKASTSIIIPHGGGGDTELAVALSASETSTVEVDSVSGFESTGVLLIGSEEIRYSAKVVGSGGSNDSFTIGTSPAGRAHNNTAAVAHLVDADVNELVALDSSYNPNNMSIDGITIEYWPACDHPGYSCDTRPGSGVGPYTCQQMADHIVASLASAATYDVNIDTNNNRKIIFTNKTAGTGGNAALISVPVSPLNRLQYYQEGANKATLAIPDLSGGASADFYTEDIEIWGVSMLNLFNTFGGDHLASAHVVNADEYAISISTTNYVAAIAIKKDDSKSIPIPWLDNTHECDEYSDPSATPYHATQEICEAATNHTGGGDQNDHWKWNIDVRDWERVLDYPGARNKGSDTYTQFFRFPIYCKGNPTNNNFYVGVDVTDRTRATWFFRPVKARGLDHGWV